MVQLTPEEFVLRAIVQLRKPPYKGIHTVLSGFNAAFRQYFPDLDPISEVTRLIDEKKIVLRPAKGGVILYLPGDSPVPNADEVLKKMGLE